jgi:glutamine amidotransferase
MIAIVDYGVGNLRSVQKAFQAIGYQARIVAQPEELNDASSIVLPGVGAFGDAMDNLREGGWVAPLLGDIRQEKPFMGICLGMQLLFEQSDEMGVHRGLGLFPGRVPKFEPGLLVPQIGWNQIHIQRPHPLLEGVLSGSFAYFVHSYYVEPEDENIVLAETDYGIHYASVVGMQRAFGIQFHPEKSQDVGLRILRNFARMEEGEL